MFSSSPVLRYLIIIHFCTTFSCLRSALFCSVWGLFPSSSSSWDCESSVYSLHAPPTNALPHSPPIILWACSSVKIFHNLIFSVNGLTPTYVSSCIVYWLCLLHPHQLWKIAVCRLTRNLRQPQQIFSLASHQRKGEKETKESWKCCREWICNLHNSHLLHYLQTFKFTEYM